MNTMSLNHNFLVLIQNFCTWSLLHRSLLLLYALFTLHHNNVTIHNEGVYIPFPSCALKQSNLEFNFYLPALTILNAYYLLRMRASCSRSAYITQVRFIKLLHLCSCNNPKVNFKICVGACPSVSCLPHWLV